MKVVAHLARGEALDVYDAWDARRHCRVAVKTPRPERASEPRVQRRLRREGGLLARLTHPHLVRAYETIEQPRLMVVLEPLAGQPLDALLAQLARPLPARQLALLGAQLGAALRYLHAHDCLHLDVKPANVIADNGIAKLIDLSIARPAGPGRAGIGTPDYLSPEQARGDVLAPAADVWGLGAVLFEAATLRPPFAPIPGARYSQLAMRAPSLAGERRLPRRLAALIDACLTPEPTGRPPLDAALAELENSA